MLRMRAKMWLWGLGTSVLGCGGDDGAAGSGASSTSGLGSTATTEPADSSSEGSSGGVGGTSTSTGAGSSDGTSESGDDSGGIDCEPPEIECDGRCVDADRDPLFCGDCRTQCDEGETCLAAHCVLDEAEGLTITSPEEGYDRTFVTPPIVWEPVDGAVDYDVTIARDAELTDVVASVQSLAEPSWTPDEFYMGDLFYVRVTAQPGGETALRAYAVRGLLDTPAAQSPTVICNANGGTGSGIAYALTIVGTTLFATRNTDGSGICRHDVETLAFEDAFGAVGGAFRTFGITGDDDGQRVFATTFPFLGSCGDSLERLVVVTDPEGASPTVDYVDIGNESAHTVVYSNGRVFTSGLLTQSCYDADTFCLDFGEACPDGFAAFVAYDVDAGSELTHDATSWGDPGGFADEARVYRSGTQSRLLVHDAQDGGLLFDLALAAGSRGIIGLRDGDDRFLVISGFDGVVRIYQLLNHPVDSADDIVLVNAFTGADTYWQGDVDELGRLFFPGQQTRLVYRHDVVP